MAAALEPVYSVQAGLDGEIEELAGIFSHVYRGSRFAGGGDLHFIGIVYWMRIVGGELRDEIDGSTDTSAWFAPGDLAGIRLVELAEYAVGLAYSHLSQ